MIEVIIREKGSSEELAHIEIENLSGDVDYADYAIKVATEKGKSVGVHKRGLVNFPRKKYNVLALLLQALNSFEPRDLELDGNPIGDLPKL